MVHQAEVQYPIKSNLQHWPALRQGYKHTSDGQQHRRMVQNRTTVGVRYKMGISAVKTKLMTNSANGIQKEIKVEGQKLLQASNTLEQFLI